MGDMFDKVECLQNTFVKVNEKQNKINHHRIITVLNFQASQMNKTDNWTAPKHVSNMIPTHDFLLKVVSKKI